MQAMLRAKHNQQVPDAAAAAAANRMAVLQSLGVSQPGAGHVNLSGLGATAGGFANDSACTLGGCNPASSAPSFTRPTSLQELARSGSSAMPGSGPWAPGAGFGTTPQQGIMQQGMSIGSQQLAVSLGGLQRTCVCVWGGGESEGGGREGGRAQCAVWRNPDGKKRAAALHAVRGMPCIIYL